MVLKKRVEAKGNIHFTRRTSRMSIIKRGIDYGNTLTRAEHISNNAGVSECTQESKIQMFYCSYGLTNSGELKSVDRTESYTTR